MPRITIKNAQAWLEGTKLTIASLDQDLLELIEAEVVGQLASITDISVWINETSTPVLVRTIISKMYAAWVYDRQYSEDIDQTSNYAEKLKINAQLLLTGLLAGTIELPGVHDVSGSPAFYPTAAS